MNNNTQQNYSDDSRIAIFGASGGIGKSIVDALRARGMSYKVVGRDRDSLTASFGSDPKAEIATWNPDDAASVRAAAKNVDTLIYTVGIPYNQFHLHPIRMQQTLDGAIEAGVKRIILIGTVYPYGAPTTPKVAETHSRNPTTYKGRMRKEQEEILLRAHAEGKIEATILRLPDFYGVDAGDKSVLHLLFKAATTGGAADMIGPIDTPHEFVYVPDAGPIILDLAAKHEAYGHWWNFAGSGVTTQKEIIDAVFAMAGRKPKLRVVGKTGLQILGLFNPIMREMVEMHYLQTTPVLLDDTALTKLLGPIDRTSYAVGLKQTFDAYVAGVDKKRK